MFHRILIAIVSAATLLSGAASRPHAQSHALRAFQDLGALRQASTAYTPEQMATAYGFAPLAQQRIDGSGQTVALVEIDALDRAALQHFDATYSLPAPNIQEYEIGGKGFKKENSPETTADVEWLHALAPGAAIQIYYMRNNQTLGSGWSAMASAVRSATGRGAATISISLGSCGPDLGSATVTAAFADLMRHGVSVFVSSGDSGDHPGPTKYCGRKLGVAYPAGDPSVVSVGGTSLRLDVDDSIGSEVGWRLSGGGKVRSLLRPGWQVARNIPPDKYRWAPDVAFVGDPHTGLRVFFHGRWGAAGGTSMGAPGWAATWALIRQSVEKAGGHVDKAAPIVLYRLGNSSSYPQIFHDVISGSNGHYRAQAGWDAVTGWGTPNVSGLAAALQPASPAEGSLAP